MSRRGKKAHAPFASSRSPAEAAARAARRAWAPYSTFRVGAAILDDRGEMYTGANLENAAYPLGICAERAALLAWRVAGGGTITDVVIHTDTEVPTPPCGLCRDALARWSPGARVYLHCRAGLSSPRGPADWLPGASVPSRPPARAAGRSSARRA